jgi:hypothetical protein
MSVFALEIISNTAKLSNYLGSHHVLFELIKHVEVEFKSCQSSVSRKTKLVYYSVDNPAAAFALAYTQFYLNSLQTKLLWHASV